MDVDTLLVNHCSPTLAGLKMGTLLCLPHEVPWQEHFHIFDIYNQKYNKKGLHFLILFRCPQRTLLYVYRPAMVEIYLRRKEISSFLQSYGYQSGSTLTAMLNHLSRRFYEGGCFPHESGIFLGYPLEDVCGFITNQGNHAKLCGDWKVYGDALEASLIFKKFNCCRQDYMNRLAVGTTLESLIVA